MLINSYSTSGTDSVTLAINPVISHELWLLQTQHMSGLLWYRYSVTVNHVMRS
jgi:hypothetical protein